MDDQPDCNELSAVIRWLDLRCPRWGPIRISTEMRQRIVALLQAQAARIVALEAELDDSLYPPEGDDDDDGIRTSADAVAAINEITACWERRKGSG